MTAPAPDICRWCNHTRPDHAEGCPVRQVAEGLAKTMGARTGEVTEFKVRVVDDGGSELGAPPTGQPRDDCSWYRGYTATGVVTTCGCGTHVGEPLDSLSPGQEI